MVNQKIYNLISFNGTISFGTDFMIPGGRNGLPDELFLGGLIEWKIVLYLSTMAFLN